MILKISPGWVSWNHLRPHGKQSRSGIHEHIHTGPDPPKSSFKNPRLGATMSECSCGLNSACVRAQTRLTELQKQQRADLFYLLIYWNLKIRQTRCRSERRAVYPQEDDQLSAKELLSPRVWRLAAPSLETFQRRWRDKRGLCRTAHFYTENGRHNRKSLQNNCFWFCF